MLFTKSLKSLETLSLFPAGTSASSTLPLCHPSVFGKETAPNCFPCHVSKTLLSSSQVLCFQKGPPTVGRWCYLDSFFANPFFFFEIGVQPHWGLAEVNSPVISGFTSCYGSCPFLTRRQVWWELLVKERLLALECSPQAASWEFSGEIT